jgi:hypothetical protein
MTTERLLRTNPEIGRRTKAIADAAVKDGIAYRMTEGNSCYRGGKPGMSDAFASALWGADYMLTLATNGCAGVNLHGGSRSALCASLGNHMPGENLDAAKKSDSKGGYYTPIAGELVNGFSARPIFYGMLLANQFAGAQARRPDCQRPGRDRICLREGWSVARRDLQQGRREGHRNQAANAGRISADRTEA